MNWLIKKLVDSGWVRLGLSFRWIFNTKKVFTVLVNEADIKKIENRYKLIEKSGFFSGKKGLLRQQTFIQALFAYDRFKNSAFSRALPCEFSSSGSVVDLEAFFSFIRRSFFHGPLAEANKATLLKAVLTPYPDNVISQAARVKNRTPQAELNPLSMVLNFLTEADCFTGPLAVPNKKRLLKSIYVANKEGENAIYHALSSRDICASQDKDPCPNIKLLLEVLNKADFSSTESYKKAFINAVFSPGTYGGVLSEAMWNPHALQQILTALTEVGCFANESGIQAFIKALTTMDCLGRTPLHYAAHNYESLRLIYKQLKKTDCLKGENKQKLINTIFSQSQNGESVLFNSSSNGKSTALILKILTEANCFDGPTGSDNQQAFINAALSANEYGHTCIFNSVDRKILNQLVKLKIFEGPFAEQNKQTFIKAVLSSTKIGGKKKESALSRHYAFDTFYLLLDQLTAAGCFSCSSNNLNKHMFIQAVFAKDNHGESMLSSIYPIDRMILLLKKLEEAGSFENPRYKEQFRQAVRADDNAMLFHMISRDFRGYLALHKCLVLAGFSVDGIKKLLNEPKKQRFDSGLVATPLMMALRDGYDLLAARLIADGAVLTEQQKQQLEHHKQQQEEQFKQFIAETKKAENKTAPTEIAALKKELTEVPRRALLGKYSKLGRRGSLPALSLFAKKPSGPEYARDDMILIKNTPRLLTLMQQRETKKEQRPTP